MALAILGIPLDKLPLETVRAILAGGASVCAAAGIPRGELLKELISYLRQRRRGRQRRKRDTDERGKIPNIVRIHERPKEVEGRTVPGHWESDLIIGKAHASAIGTLVERTTRTAILVPLKAKDAETVRKSFARVVKRLPGVPDLSRVIPGGSNNTRPIGGERSAPHAIGVACERSQNLNAGAPRILSTIDSAASSPRASLPMHSERPPVGPR